MRRDGAKIFGIVGAMFLVIGSILTTVFCWGLPPDIGIDLHTQRLQGVVTGAALDLNMTINSRHPLRIAYSYRLAGKTFSDDHATIDEDFQEAYGAAGLKVPLEIDSERPEWSRIEGTRHATFGYFGLFMLLFPLVGLATLTAAAYNWLKA
jgi:hypothetical protein